MTSLLIIVACLLGASAVAKGLAAGRSGSNAPPTMVLDIVLATVAVYFVVRAPAGAAAATLFLPIALLYVVGGTAYRALENRRLRKIRSLSEGRRLETFLHVSQADETEGPSS